MNLLSMITHFWAKFADFILGLRGHPYHSMHITTRPTSGLEVYKF